MRFVRFHRGDALPRVGLLQDGTIREIRSLAGQRDPLVSLLAEGPGALQRAGSTAEATEERVSEVTLLAPITAPPKLICIGLNYESHRLEVSAPEQTEPTVFGKFASSISGPCDAIQLPAVAPKRVDYEAELAVVLGGTGRDVSEADAMSLVAGYTVANDITARDWQVKKPQGQWELGKSFDTFLPLGPSLVTADEVDDPHALRVTCEVAGEMLQDGNTNDLIFSIPFLIAYLSQVCTLQPGDVILTGTPGGVGMSRNPPRWLAAGEVVRTTVGDLGQLENPVLAAPSS
jgi:2-keto-4-pentenoate hydratase/2-oxohepta-3-ene-1,7-dioic acid hydratase in catechol pathway